MIASSFSGLLVGYTGGDAVAALGFGLAVFVVATLAFRARNVGRIRSRLEPHLALGTEDASDTGVRERLAFLSGLFEATERAFGGLKLWRNLTMALERADVPLRPAEFFYGSLASGLVLAVLVALVGAPIAVALLVFVLGAIPPILVLSLKVKRRQQAFDDQLPDLMMTMAGSLRSGHTFRQAMQAIVEEGDEPASKEFKRVLLEMGIGRPLEEALEDMAARMGSTNFGYVISVISVQREVGGSLGGLFDMVSETVRQRQQFGKRVHALTTMGRWSAYIMCGLPFFLAAALTALRPSYMAPLFTTSRGHVLLLLALAGIAVGSLVVKRIISFRMA